MHLEWNPLVREIIDVPIGNDQVWLTIQLGIQELGAKSQQVKTGLPQRRLAGTISKQSPGLLDIKRVGFLVEVGDEQIRQAILVIVLDGNTHACLGLTSTVVSQATHHRFFRESFGDTCLAATGVIKVGGHVIGHEHTEPARPIEISRHDPQALAVGCHDPHPLGCILETSISEVQPQAILLSIKLGR